MKKNLISIALGVIISAMVSIAYGYWSVSGQANGSGGTNAPNAVTISSATATPSGLLLPGKSGDISFKVSNPNGFNVTLTEMVGSGPISISGGNGCTAANAGITVTDQTNLNISIPAGSQQQTIDIPGAVSMSATSANGCQGATFYIPITITTSTK